MIKHIVFWKLKDQAHGNDKSTNAQLIRKMVHALRGKIPSIGHIEVGIDFSKTDASFDVALYSEFADQAALDAYQDHPDHKAMMPFIAEARSERRVVDYVV